MTEISLIVTLNNQFNSTPMTKSSSPTENKKSKATKQLRLQNFRLHSHCRPTYDGLFEKNDSNLTNVVKPVYAIPTFPLNTKVVVKYGVPNVVIMKYHY